MATEKIREAFAVFDTDGSGALDRAQFRTVLMSSRGDAAAPLSDAEVLAVFEQVDTNTAVSTVYQA
jgi:Ca2+-binding EF-hand superfamily protein